MTVTRAPSAWFNDARFGMFIHWGAYAVPARGEWVMWNERIPPSEYAAFGDRFKARHYDPSAWAACARDAGMKYMVLTTRHHDGYCLFDTTTTDFNAAKTGPRRDLVAPFVDACRAAGLKVGLYYSLGDWRCPAYWRTWSSAPRRRTRAFDDMVACTHAQVQELMTRYGRIDMLWYDGGFSPEGSDTAEAFDARRLNAMVRRHQPGILINDRSGLPEDFTTPEQQIRAAPSGRLWEACMTHNRHWGIYADDDVWKPAREIVIHLTACACGGGNYLLNVGPDAEGRFPKPTVDMLRQVGRWMRRNGEAIYGAGRCAVPGANFGVTTARAGRVYLLVHWWAGDTLRAPNAGVRPKRAWMLSTGQRVRCTQDGRDLLFTDLPRRSPDPFTTVIALDV